MTPVTHRSATPVPRGASARTPHQFKRVVVAVGDDGGAAATALASALGGPHTEFILTRVLDDRPVHGALPAEAFRPADGTRGLLECARIALGGHSCELASEPSGSVARGLQRLAARRGADLIVTGPSGTHHGGGTISELLHGAPCAIAIAAPGLAPRLRALSRVAVAFLPTPAARRGVEVARAIASEHHAELHAVTVVPIVPSAWTGPVIGAVQIIEQLDGDLAERARGHLHEVDDATGHVLEGDPVIELRLISKMFDLLVVGARSGGALQRLLTGSTTDDLSSRLSCPLLVVPAPDSGTHIHRAVRGARRPPPWPHQ